MSRPFRALPAFAGTLLVIFLGVLTPGQADWRDDIGIFRVGYVSQHAPGVARQQLLPFKRALEAALEMRVEVLVMPSYQALIDAHISSRVQYAIYSSAAYATAWINCECVRPIVVPKDADGSTGFHSILIADSGKFIDTIDGMSGKRVFFSARGSVAGHWIPFSELTLAGRPPPTHFAQMAVTENAVEGIKRMLSGEADATFGWSSMIGDPVEGFSRGSLRQAYAAGAALPTDIQVIWQSRSLSHGPHAVRTNLPQEATDVLILTLTNLKEDNPLAYEAASGRYQGGFAEADPASYQPFIDMLATAHDADTVLEDRILVDP